MNRRQRTVVWREDGVALIMALIILVVLSTLAASLIMVTQTEIWSSANYRALIQARYVAEAGAQRAANWMVNSYPAPTDYSVFDMTRSPVLYNGQPVVLSGLSSVAANYPDVNVQNAFRAVLSNQALSGVGANASYSATATLVRMQKINTYFSSTPSYLQTWQITSQGNISTVRPAQVQVTETIERAAIPMLNYVLFSTANQCESMELENNIVTDSFNSSAGGYAATHQNSGGHIGSNGNIQVQNNATINGSIFTPFGNTVGSCPPMSAVTGTANATGGLQTIPPVTYPTPPPPNPLPPTTTLDLSTTCPPGCISLAQGTGVSLAPGSYGNVTCSIPCTVHLSAGVYNLNSFIFDKGAANIVLDSGPVIINLAGQGVSDVVDISHAANVITPGQVPSNLQMFYGGTGEIEVESNSPFYGLVYAPNAAVEYESTADFYGAIVGSTIEAETNAGLHYDRALGNSLQTPDKYHVMAFSWSKY